MMTIKAFATLCGCHPQTLRYYDKIDLLKPVQVDQWSGYRYYARSQAIDFVKIKNLQAADFTIDEIKALLAMSDQQVHEAFDRKIAQQTRKLERIKEIQQSYLTEKNNMEKLVQNVADYLLHAVSNYEVLREFGLSASEGPAIVAQLRDYIEKSIQRHLPAEPDVHLIVNDQVICGADHAANAFADLMGKGYDDTILLGDEKIREDEGFTAENSETLWECHGWNYVHEFIDRIPQMNPGCDYCFFFQMTEEKVGDGPEFPMFMIAAMLPKVDADEVTMSCIVRPSIDDQNHFSLLCRK